MQTHCTPSRQHFALYQPTEWALSLDTVVDFDLEPGDIIRGCNGLVWTTVDGESADIMLAVGDTYEVPRQQRMRFNGFDDARMVILARGPVAIQPPRRSWERTLYRWKTALVQRWFPGGRELRA